VKLIKNTTVVAHSKAFVFRRVEIGGKGNQCLQIALDVFYKKFNDLKHATVLWNLVSWSNTKMMHCNDNAFVFNRLLGYNIAFYDLGAKYWYWDKVNSQAATCYIKFSEKHYDYIQPLCPHTLSLDQINDRELITPIANVFPTVALLEGIVKHITPLYTHVIFKVKSIVTIRPTSNETRLDEFQIKSVLRLELPVLRIGKGVITEHVDFSLTMKNSDFYEHKFTVYSNCLSVKYKSLIKHNYEHLNVEELKKLKLTVEKSQVSTLKNFKTCVNVRTHIIK